MSDPKRGRMPVNVKNFPSIMGLEMFAGTMKSVRISGSPAIAIKNKRKTGIDFKKFKAIGKPYDKELKMIELINFFLLADAGIRP